MSQKLISRNTDLSQLRSEGYSIEIRNGYLIVKDVPYLDAQRSVQRGTIVVKLVLAGDVVKPPDTHTIFFSGSYPHQVDGLPIEKFRCNSDVKTLAEGVTVQHQFSAKPKPSGLYANYYDQVLVYCSILGAQARRVDPTATAKCFSPVIPDEDEHSPFHYLDTATSRAEIGALSNRLAIQKVAIVGLGGTGAYVLDLIAKTPIQEIHVFDGDRYLTHNAFRAPGASSIEELRSEPLKVDYFAAIYSKMHRGIVAHPEYVDFDNIAMLREMDFIFLCLDDNSAKRFIIREIEEFGVSFIDVGMGVYVGDNGLGGLIRVTTSTPQCRNHIRVRVPQADADEENEYAQNIQIADLNAMNAAMAVIKWKKLLGFYMDFQHEHHTTYGIESQLLTRAEQHV